MLSPEQLQRWQQDGFLVLPGFKPADEVARLRERAIALAQAFEPTPDTGVFSTTQPRKLADAALIASADQVHGFFEEEAFDAAGRLRQAHARSLNKIGHALHDRDPVFSAFSRDPRLAELARDLGVARARLWQSMLIFKPPAIGGEVRWHQDATYLITEPQSVLGLWFALEDATRDNGCLWLQPGGHRGPLRERFGRGPEGLVLERLDDTPWPTLEQSVCAEVEAGALVVFHGLTPHCSAANRSPHSRMAYTLHIADASSAWSDLNWLQRPAGFPARGFD